MNNLGYFHDVLGKIGHSPIIFLKYMV